VELLHSADARDGRVVHFLLNDLGAYAFRPGPLYAGTRHHKARRNAKTRTTTSAIQFMLVSAKGFAPSPLYEGAEHITGGSLGNYLFSLNRRRARRPAQQNDQPRPGTPGRKPRALALLRFLTRNRLTIPIGLNTNYKIMVAKSDKIIFEMSYPKVCF